TSNWGGGLYLNHAQSATLARNQLFDNVGERGGAIASHNSDSVLLTATEITSNAAAYGGGLYLDGSHATLTNTMLTHNIANSRGAGAYLTSGTARLFHATLARNVGHQGVYLEAGSAAWIANTIVVSHTVGIEAGTASSATLEGTLWGAGAWANLTDTSTAVGGAVTTVADVRGEPAFAAPAAGDYHITGASAAIDAGVDAGVDVDIDGDPRPVRGGYDVGADEYVGCLASLNAGAVYTSVQAAIDASGSATDVVRVAGSCYEHDIVLDKTLTLQGGWSPDFSIRNPETHIATLDAEGRGRVMRIAAGSPVVEGLHIVNGSLSSGDGAGVYVGPAASPTVRHNHLTSNATGSQGQGGAICVDDSAAVTLDGNRIYGNSSGGAGGGVFIDSGSAVIVDNVIHGNTTWNVSDGGGIAIAAYSAASLERNTVTGNMAHRNGGGLTVGSRTLAMLINNIVADNACCDASGSVGGAGIWLGSGDHVLIHNTVADNEVSGDHGGVDAEAIRLYGDAVLTNTIIASHTVGVVVADADHTATLEGTLWHANGQDTSGAGTVVTGSVDLHQDPTFARPQADDYHLLDGSPAIDAGVPSGVRDDVDGEARPRGRTYDIGADEYPDPIFFIYLPLVIRGS
ncbi:MAG: right-handed parallel beta-helix repeat-containing protein, partial [Anaerolineae bacterium]